MATNPPSCFLIQCLEKLLTFLANFTLLKYVKSQRSYGFLIMHKRADFWFPNFGFKRSLLSLLNQFCIFEKLMKQEPSGHPTSASNVAWVIVNYSSMGILAFYDRGKVDSPLPSSENNVTVEVGQ